MQQRAEAIQDGQALTTRLNWPRIEDIVLLRLVVGAPEGETEVQLRKDLHQLIMHQMSVSEWRTGLGQVIVNLVDKGLIRPVRANAYLINEQAEPRILALLRQKRMPTSSWHEIRDGHLVALALGLTPNAKLIARLLSAEGLRCVIIAEFFKLDTAPEEVTLDELRLYLAKVAERRGLTAGIRTEPIDEATLTQKDAVMMGAKLLKSRQVVESDGELMACLAAELIGAVNESAGELRQMLYHRLISAKDTGAVEETPIQNVSQTLPPLEEFAAVVLEIASSSAVGWPGNKKAYISHVWRDLRVKFQRWGLSNAEYKELIFEAHRAGLLRLAIADLRDKNNVQDVNDSRISYKNSEWHFIRTEETNE